jgi:hypothetical protein
MKETFDKVSSLFEEFVDNHNKFVNDGNKSAAQRARKSIGEIKKLATQYRKESVEATKN